MSRSSTQAMDSSSEQPLEVLLDGRGAEVVVANINADEEAKLMPVDALAEEKKQTEPSENDGSALGNTTAEHLAETNLDPSSSTTDAMLSPTVDAPKQTLSGAAALHSSAAAKVTPSTKSTVYGPTKDGKSQDVAVSLEHESIVSPSNQAAQAKNDDEDSSNDDSSYFADPNNLPSPGEAGRKYSFSSHPSTNKNNAKGRESDASLSLSDDSDDVKNNTNNSNNALYGQREAPEVFPQQRITRMHSVGSLVSTSSQNTDDEMALGGEHRHIPHRVFDSHIRPAARVSTEQGPHVMYSAHGQQFQHGPSHNMVPDNRQYHMAQGFPHPQAQMTLGQQDQWLADARVDHSIQQQTGGGRTDVAFQYTNEDEAMRANGSGPYHNSGTGGAHSRKSSNRRPSRESTKRRSKNHDENSKREQSDEHLDGDGNFQVYWQRWIMLMYMSVLNLLSDWTCYSVAPIAHLTQEAFGDIDPEQLVTIFLVANAFASACEPIILSRLGLRRTVLFGALLLMVGSMVKSGGMPPIIQADLEKGHCELQIYIGFFLVGLSQPLYQCTPALLSASWFPEHERTMATGVALNANQLGIGFAFIFGTLLVANSEDIPSYFGLLSIVSTVAFSGTLFQFDDAPPTPPSDSARVMRGTLEVNLPSVQTILQSIGVGNQGEMKRDIDEAMKDGKHASKSGSKYRSSSGKTRRPGKSSSKKSRSAAGPPTSDGRRHRSRNTSRKSEGRSEPQGPPPSAALWGSVRDIVSAPSPMMPRSMGDIVTAPSPMMPGNVGGAPGAGSDDGEGDRRGEQQPQVAPGYPYGAAPPMYTGNMATGVPASIPSISPVGYPGPVYGATPGMRAAYGTYQPQVYPGYQMGYPGYQQQYPFPPQTQQFYPPIPPRGPTGPYSYQHQMPRPDQQLYSDPYSVLPPLEGIDAGAEPVLTFTPHHLDIDIRDDQILLATRACFARAGFIHSLVSFAVSGIVINTLSTYMDYLVRLNGAGREYTGIIGGSFQVVIMISSLIIGGLTDKSRAYYSVTVGMLVIGAFGLAECGVSLNADRGSDLRGALIVVAALVGPLQPVSTELGVEVVYPLSENTVLVIQQLFSNLLSALFIPIFKQLKDIGIAADEDGKVYHPEYTFSFYLLIVLHAGATVFFATFNGRYLRYEHELQKKDEKERKRQEAMESASIISMGSFQPSLMSGTEGYDTGDAERQPLVVQSQIV